MPLKDVRVLVTGISGFIGSHLAHRLFQEGAEVYGLVRNGSNLWRLNYIKNQINLNYIDLLDFESTRKAILEIEPHKVFHLAAYVDVSRSLTVMDGMIEVNLKGTLNLLRALDRTNYDCFVNTGTCEEYGDNPVPFQEDQVPNPVSPYSASKASTTLFCRMLHKTRGLPILTLRPFLTYGPMQESNMLIPSLIKCSSKREQFVMTMGEQTREFNYVDDIIDGFIKASLTKKAIGETINIGNGKEYKIKDVVFMLLNIMGDPIPPLIGALPYREGEAMRFYCDNAKATDLLGWYPKVSLYDGIKKTIDWYIKEFIEDRR